jgi:hypothetical protein
MLRIVDCCYKLAKEQNEEYIGVYTYQRNPSIGIEYTIDSCGILEGFVFCPYCGKKLEIEEKEKS